MPLTTFGANANLDGDLSYGSGTPANVIIALLLELPADDPVGTDLVEPPEAAGYERLVIANNATNFPDAVGGVKSLAVQHLFAVPTDEWGLVVGYAQVTNSDYGSGLVYRWGRYRQPRRVVVGSAPKILAGDLLVRAAINDPTD